MNENRKKILEISFVVVCLLLIVSYFSRQFIVRSYYGDLESFSYYTGGGVAGYYEKYRITRLGDEFILSAWVIGSDTFEVSCTVDSSVADRVRDLIVDQNLYLRNGVDESEEGLCDGLGETLDATFSGGTLSYNYYGTSVYRNAELADYLLALSKECYGIEHSPTPSTSIATEPSVPEVSETTMATSQVTTIAATSETTAEVTLAPVFLIEGVNYSIWPAFDEAMPFNPYGYAVVGVLTDGVMKYGVIDESGSFVIEPEYDDFRAPTFEMQSYNPAVDIGHIWLKKDGLWGFIDQGCKWVTELAYEDCTSFSNIRIAGVKIGDKWGLISASGAMITDAIYDEVRTTDTGEYIDVLRDGLWGLVNDSGREVLGPISTTPIITSNTKEQRTNWGLSRRDLALTDNASSLITLDGRVIIEGATNGIGSISIGDLFYANLGEGQNGYYDLTGTLVIPLADNESGSVFSKNGIALITAKNGSDRSYYFINSLGNNFFGKVYTEAHEFAENGLACVKQDGLFGYIDNTGEMVIAPQFDKAYDFHPDGYAIVEKDGNMMVIDHEGNVLISSDFDSITRVAPYTNTGSSFIATKDRLAGMIGNDGNWLLQPFYSQIIPFDPEAREGLNLINCSSQIYAMNYQNKKFGILSAEGEILLPPISEAPFYISTNGYTSILIEDKYGYVDLDS